jgi:hypothetical protein
MGKKELRLVDEPVRKKPEKLPWPRNAEDGTPLGIDVILKKNDIIKIVYKHFKVHDYQMEELLQEIFLAIIYKNCSNSAHDPRKSSFGHYVYLISNNVCINIVNKRKKHEAEKESIDEPYFDDERRSLQDIIPEDEDRKNIDEFNIELEDMERRMRKMGLWLEARYMRAVRSGASSNVIKEALSWNGNIVTTKMIRNIKNSIKSRVKEIRL